LTDLPDDIAQLKAMLLQLQAKERAQAEEIAELKTTVQLLVEQLNLSKSKRFSSQSEKVAKGMFNEAEQQHALPNVNKSKAKTGRKPYLKRLSVKFICTNSAPLVVNVAKAPFMNAEKK
jgi:transposase